MKIETLTEWNAVLSGCGCCPMPGAPPPALLCESMEVSLSESGLFYDADGRPHSKRVFTSTGAVSNTTTSTFYHPSFTANFFLTGPSYTHTSLVATDSRKETSEAIPQFRTYKCGIFTGSISKTLSGAYNKTTTSTPGYTQFTPEGERSFFTHQDSIDTVAISVANTQWSETTTNESLYPTSDNPWAWDNPTSSTETQIGAIPLINPTESYEGPVAMDAVKPIIAALISSASFSECPSSNGFLCQAQYQETARNIPGVGLFIGYAMARKVRYRWEIPSLHLGAYFKITWDILNLPTVGSATLDKDLTVVWVGPGSGDQADPSWLTAWNEITAPLVPGVRRVVNVRYESYKSLRFGTKPQLTGEGFALPV